VPEGYFRTWIERYHVSDYDLVNPVVDSPDGGKDGFPPILEPGGKNFFVRKCAITARFTLHAGLPGRRHVHHPRWRRARGQEVLHRLPVLHPACPYGCRFLNPKTQTAEKCTLCYHRITKGLTTACL